MEGNAIDNKQADNKTDAEKRQRTNAQKRIWDANNRERNREWQARWYARNYDSIKRQAYCECCDYHSSRSNMKAHMKTKKHQRIAELVKQIPRGETTQAEV